MNLSVTCSIFTSMPFSFINPLRYSSTSLATSPWMTISSFFSAFFETLEPVANLEANTLAIFLRSMSGPRTSRLEIATMCLCFVLGILLMRIFEFFKFCASLSCLRSSLSCILANDEVICVSLSEDNEDTTVASEP